MFTQHRENAYIVVSRSKIFLDGFTVHFEKVYGCSKKLNYWFAFDKKYDTTYDILVIICKTSFFPQITSVNPLTKSTPCFHQKAFE